MVAAIVASAVLAQRAFDLYSYGPYESRVPRPESVLGYEIGTKHSTFRDQERYIQAAVAAAPDRVQIREYGTSTEGRQLKVLIIGSKANMARLPEIEKQHEALAAGKGDPKNTVPILWINECIHGDETASFEAGMVSLYTLLDSENPAIKDALDKCLVILNPVYNPDGHERYVVFYNAVSVGSPEPEAYERSGPSVMYGRVNHYRFDMNRDRVAFSQKETQAEYPTMLKWAPQVYIDQHGQVGTYFMPPESQAINENVGRERNAKWKEVFGRATAKAFDKNGMSYFIKDTFDFFYPGYLDVSTSLSGAIGMTHETDGGRYIASKRVDGSILTFKQGISKHFVSAMAVLGATAANGQALVADYDKFKKEAVEGKATGKFQRVVMQGDRRALARAQKQLQFAGVTSQLTAGAWSQDHAHEYWSDKVGRVDFKGPSLVVDMDQPQARMAKALLEPDANFEPEFVKAQIAKKSAAPEGETYPGPDGGEFYDMTAWSIPYANGLKAWWCESRPALPATPIESPSAASTTVGFALPYLDQEDVLAVGDALRAGVRGSVTTKPLQVDGRTLPAGTFLFLADRNDEGYEDKLAQAAKAHGAMPIPLSTAYPDAERYGPGSDAVNALKQPKVAIVMGTRGNLADSGAIWYLFDQVFHLPFTPVDQSFLNSPDLNKYTTIILPRGTSAPAKGKFADWLAAGGTAVVLGNPGWAIGSDGFAELTPIKGKLRDLPGSLFRAQLDKRSFLTYGYDRDELAFPMSGDTFWHVKKEGGSVVRLSDDPKAKRLLAGWSWPEETEKGLQGAVLVHDQPVGRGHMVLFMEDPTERAMWPGLYKLLLNATLLGPSF